ncbi:MAG TPA: hypothetical protein VHV08_17895, partial [Pirellulales bacterium]|nr:hypothetical protein [Pirellulales bacterium]
MKRPRLVNRPDVRFFRNHKFSLERSPSAGLEVLECRQMLSGVDLLVAAYDSTGGNSVLRFNDITHSPTQGTVATGDHGLDPPSGLAVNPVDHSFYVSSPSSGGILHYDVNGNYIDSIGVGTLLYPGTLAIGPNGNLYAADIYAATIYQFSTTTEAVVNSDFLGYAPAGMTFVPDGSNDLVVGGFDNQDVIRYTSSGPVTLVDASQGLNINPLSLVAEANGDVVIGDSNISPPDSANHHALWLYDASTGLTTLKVNLTTPTDPGNDPPQPSSLLLDTDGNLLVGLSPDHVGDGAIEKYDIDDFSYMGTPISNIGSTAGMALIPSIASAVAGTDLFYKGSSAFDVTNGATFSDDNTIAPDKSAYLPGTGNATFASVSSYTQG